MVDGVRVEHEEHGVAIGLSLRGLRLSDRAARARLVLDNDRAAEAGGEARSDDARDPVHRAACRPGNDQADRLAWETLSEDHRCKQGCGERTARDKNTLHRVHRPTFQYVIDAAFRIPIASEIVPRNKPCAIFPSGMSRDNVGTIIRTAKYERRSEERRVGKECRSRWSPDHYKKK